MELYMITTTDNPFSPVDQYDEWLTWDMAHYNSNALLARVVHTSPELSDVDRALAIQEGIDEIVEYNVSGVHTKVFAGSLDWSWLEPSDDETTSELAA
jgi:hypothetical protein